MSAIEIEDLVVEKNDSAKKRLVRILHGVSLAVAPGELMVLVGPSGCGKSTLLRALAGLDPVAAGRVCIAGREVTHAAPAERDIAMVFQSYALYPHMTVAENLAFALRLRKQPRADIEARVQQVAELLQIGPLLPRLPRELSGGQRQRVAIGRAVIRRPALYLFDEPLSNLDAALRQQMRVELLRLHQQLATTTVYVTHDQTEAMTLAQRIAVLRAGHIVQVGTPREIYDKPKNRFVAGFFGSPEMNFLPGRIEADRFVPQTGEGTLRVLQYPTGPALLGVRAEDLHIETDPSGVGLPVVCELIEDLGADCLVHARHHHRALAFRSTRQHLPLVGSTVTLRCAPERLHLFSAAPTDAPHEALRLLPQD